MSTATSPSIHTAKKARVSARARAPFKSNDGRLTVEEWAKLPETKPHYELIDGILKQKMPTRRRHSHTAAMLHFLLMQWGFAKGWMFYTEGTGMKADDFNGFVPDVSGFAPGTTFDPDAVYDQAPFFVAEILPPSTANADRTTKMKAYARAEVEIYLLIDAKKRTVEAYRLEGQTFGEPQRLGENDVWAPEELPGLELGLAQLWMPARKSK